MAKLSTIEGVGPAYETKLKEAGIGSLEALLKAGASKKGRKDIAEKTGIQEKMILTWVNHADLMRIKGVGGQYAELLEAAGVDTVPELAHRNADNLCQKMLEINEKKHLVRVPPTVVRVETWVEEAKTLGRMVEH
jgi:predicted flap endonuclease-1-like 5' DNA nuclease